MRVQSAQVLSYKTHLQVILVSSNAEEAEVMFDRGSKVPVKRGTKIAVLKDRGEATISIVAPKALYGETDPRKFGNQMLSTFKKGLKL